jgi:integrase
MGKTTSTHVEQSIWRTNAGKYQVRVVSSKGKQKRVKVTVPTLAEARLMRDAADQARKEGRSIKLAWNAIRGINGTPVCRVPIDEMFKRYLAHGDTLVSQGGDHKDPAPRSGSAETRRPTTQEGYLKHVDLVKRLIDELGDVRFADDLTADKLRKVREEMRDRGLAVATQKSQLVHVYKALEHLDAGEQPPGFPDLHRKVRALKPKNPLKRPPDPQKWGGNYGDDLPALPLHKAFAIAEEMGPERGLAVYLMAIMGLRRGETFGLTLDKISRKGDRLYIQIDSQRHQLEILPWVKSRASYRTLPVPEVMVGALVGYCSGLHGWDPMGGQKPPDPSSLLVLSPSRKIEKPSDWGRAFHATVEGGETSYEELGYELTPHHLRKSVSALVLNAAPIAGKESGMPEEHLAALGVTRESLLQLGLQVPAVNASGWLGHETRADANNPLAAAAVTLGHYNPTITALGAREATADWLTFVARFDKWIADKEPWVGVGTWTLPVPQFDEFRLDGEDGWRAYRLYAQEHDIDVVQLDNLAQPRNWLHNVLRARPETVDVWAHRTRDKVGCPVVDEGADSWQVHRPMAAWRVEVLDVVRTYLESASTEDVFGRLGLCQGPSPKQTSEYTRGHEVLKRLIDGGFIEVLPEPYSKPHRRFDRGEVERVYEALVVAPFLDALHGEGRALTPEAIADLCQDEPILMAPSTGRPARPATRKAQVERCLKALKKDRLVKKNRNGTWNLTDKGLKTHDRLTVQAGE